MKKLGCLTEPKPKGKLAIYPEIRDGRELRIVILGDSDGLTYLSDVLRHYASLDVNARNIPDGAREHTHWVPGNHMVEHSVRVEICRAEAKGTGDLPESIFGE